MKLRGKLPKDDANGIEAYETELAGNLMNGKVVPAIVLLATEDVLAKNAVPLVFIDDIEGVPDEHRAHVLELMSAIKSERMGRAGKTPLEMPEADDEAEDASPIYLSDPREPVEIDDPDGSI